MVQNSHISNISTRQPSKPAMFVALIFAMSLPFLLVKMFPHQQLTLSKNISSIHQIAQTMQTSPKREEAPANMIAEIIAAKTQQPKQNVSTVQSKAPTPPSTITKPDWTIVKTQTGDSLAVIFKRLGLSAKTLHQLLQEVPETKRLARMKPNQEFKFFIQNQKLEKIVLPYSKTQKLFIVLKGQHFQQQGQVDKEIVKTDKITNQNHFVSASIHGSLFGTAKKRHIPYKLVQQMTQIFAWDINFARDIQDGDQFTILYKSTYSGAKLIETGDILAVSFRNNGKLFNAIRHTVKSTGQTDYFTPEGMSAQKAFDRYPIRFSHISSTFSLSRYHPVLHYNRAHHGVDLAARIGTPIQATGSGRIEVIGRQGGYGNMIKINHTKSYSTVYGHMLKFQKGLSRGSFVRRGQIIGYVGQTGLASGPHCHYEFRVSEQPKNPSTVQLPRSIPLSGRELASFQAKARTLIAQMKSFEKKQLTG